MEENEDVKLLSFLSHNNAFNELFAGDGRFGKRGRFDDQFVLEFLFIQLTEYLLFLFLFFFWISIFNLIIYFEWACYYCK